MRKRILFVGHSDTRLVPLCAAVLAAMCSNKKMTGIKIRSCGFWATEGQSVHPNLSVTAGELGLDLSSHRAHYITQKDTDWADWVIPQDDMILRGLQVQLEEDKRKLFKPMRLSDPSNLPLTAFRQSREEVLGYCEKLLRKLSAEEKNREKIKEAVCIRPVGEGDIDRIVQAEQACFTHPWTGENIRSELEKEQSCFLAAYYHETMVGYGSLSVVWQVAYMNNLAVLPDYRQMGIADRLLEELEAFCRQQKADSITLEVRSQNEAAKALYRKHGFVRQGSRRHFYRDPVDDADIMTKVLPRE